jgi:hypothetical protein
LRLRGCRAFAASEAVSISDPFLDAWFAWFPLNQIQYDGAAVGEIYNVASRIDERKSVSWIVEWTKEAERISAHAEALRS